MAFYELGNQVICIFLWDYGSQANASHHIPGDHRRPSTGACPAMNPASQLYQFQKLSMHNPDLNMPPQPPLPKGSRPIISLENSFSQNINTSEIHNQHNISESSRDDQVHDLMSSIQNKLSMLVCEDSCEAADFELSKLNSPKREYLTATDEKTNNRARITMQDLSSSHCRRGKPNDEKAGLEQVQRQEARREESCWLGESRVLNRINEMEEFYMGKIQDLTRKIAAIQFDYEALGRECEEMRKENGELRRQVEEHGLKGQRQLDQKVEEVRKELVRKFTDESQHHFEQHIKEMKELNDELSNERSKRKYLDNEVQMLNSEKLNLEDFYRNLLQDHRNIIRIDAHKIGRGPQHQAEPSGTARRAPRQPSQSLKQPGQFLKQSSIPSEQALGKRNRQKKGKREKEESVKEESVDQSMSKEEMIPFLAKGIQDLKQKLRLQ